MADPIKQFEVVPLVDFGAVTLPFIGTQQIAFTNSHLAMTIAFLAVLLFLQVVTAGAKVVPGRLQAVGEQMFGLIDGVTDSIIGHEGRRYFPFVFALFCLILSMNLLGMFLTFTATSQLAVTGTFALLTILLVVGIGISRHGLGFFLLFWPSSAPLVLRPIVGAIEFPAKFTDFRKQELAAGVYTLRFAVQPDIGDHTGTSPQPNFCLLCHAEDDKNDEHIEKKKLIEISSKVNEGRHPAVLLMWPNNGKDATVKVLDKGNGVLVATIKRAVVADGGKTTLGFAVTVAGVRKE